MEFDLKSLSNISLLGSTPDGSEVLSLIKHLNKERQVIYVVRDDKRIDLIKKSFEFFAPNISYIDFPAWDCLPYDRVSPNSRIISRRMEVLVKLLRCSKEYNVLLTTVNAITQFVLPAGDIQNSHLVLTAGQKFGPEKLKKYLISIDGDLL